MFCSRKLTAGQNKFHRVPIYKFHKKQQFSAALSVHKHLQQYHPLQRVFRMSRVRRASIWNSIHFKWLKNRRYRKSDFNPSRRTAEQKYLVFMVNMSNSIFLLTLIKISTNCFIIFRLVPNRYLFLIEIFGLTENIASLGMKWPSFPSFPPSWNSWIIWTWIHTAMLPKPVFIPSGGLFHLRYWPQRMLFIILMRFIERYLFTPGWIGLKFDIFELMFNEILVIHMHNSQLVYNFYEQAIKLFL